jgi:hypothetical protein
VNLRVPFSTNAVVDLAHPVKSNSFTGIFTVSPENLLSRANSKKVLQDLIPGPEHLAFKSSASDGTLDSETRLPGTMFTASVNGTAYSVKVNEIGEIVPNSVKELVYTGPGRVLGLAIDSSGGFYLCNSVQVLHASHFHPSPMGVPIYAHMQMHLRRFLLRISGLLLQLHADCLMQYSTVQWAFLRSKTSPTVVASMHLNILH